MEKKPFDPKKELTKMAIGLVDEAASDFIDYIDGFPGRQPSPSEKWALMDHFLNEIIREVNSRRRGQ